MDFCGVPSENFYPPYQNQTPFTYDQGCYSYIRNNYNTLGQAFLSNYTQVLNTWNVLATVGYNNITINEQSHYPLNSFLVWETSVEGGQIDLFITNTSFSDLIQTDTSMQRLISGSKKFAFNFLVRGTPFLQINPCVDVKYFGWEKNFSMTYTYTGSSSENYLATVVVTDNSNK